jgi:hypothetical protein
VGGMRAAGGGAGVATGSQHAQETFCLKAPPPYNCSMHTYSPKQRIVFIISSGCVVVEDPRAVACVARTSASVRILLSAGLSARKTHVGAELGDINLVVRLIIIVLRSDVAATLKVYRPKATSTSGKRQGRVYV